jgi:hypothetical protein
VFLTKAYYLQGDGISERALQSVQTKIRILFKKTKNIEKCATIAVKAANSVHYQTMCTAPFKIIKALQGAEPITWI